MNRYLCVQALSSSKASRITQEQFNRAKNDYRKVTTESFEKASKDVNQLLRDRGKGISKYPKIYSGLAIGGMVSLGVLDETGRSITLGTLGSVSRGEGNEEQRKTIVGAEVVALVKGKCITAQLYSAYRSADDIDWLKELVRDWTRAFLGSN